MSRHTAMLLATVAGLALATPAVAQSAASVPTGTTPQTAPDAASASAPQSSDTASAPQTERADVVVTGSRVIRNGDASPNPVTVAPVEQILAAQPNSVVDALNTLPTFAASRGQTSNPGAGGGGGATGNSAANILNLRNLGGQRALILFDGRRVAPNTIDGFIDVDVIPELLLKRVDLVTGGASAVYGSDAVSGVVNFITDRAFNGVKAELSNGISQYGDDRNTRLGIAAGTKLGDRGHIELSYEYRDDAGIDSKLSRSFGQLVVTAQPTYPTATNGAAGVPGNPVKLYYNTRFTNLSFGGLVTNTTLARQNFSADGVLTRFTEGAAIPGNAAVQQGGDGAFYDADSLKASLRTHKAFGRFDYDLSDHVKAHVVGSYANIYNQVNGNNIDLSGTYSTRNAFLTTAQQAAFGTATTFALGKLLEGTPYVYSTNEDYWNANAGLEGDLGRFNWQVDYGRTESIQHSSVTNIDRAKFAAASDAVVSNGQIVCNVSVTNPGLYPGCVPLNVFGPTATTPDMLAYLYTRTSYRAKNEQDDASGTISGSLFDDWAGPVDVAANVEFRRLSLGITSDFQPSAVVNCTGLRYNCAAGASPYLAGTIANLPTVSENVFEQSLEANIPLLKDMRFFRALNLTAAGRHTNYTTSGDVWSWKGGLDWAINDELRLRGTRSRDIRAPELYDLYAPTNTTSNFRNADLHTGDTVVATVITHGNANLQPEKADTLTAGFVYKPGWLRGFSFAVDAYRIKINNAIVTLGGDTPAVQTVCEASGGTSFACSLLVRPLDFSNHTSANDATAFIRQPVNAASLETRGIDFEANYALSVFSRPAALRALVDYQPYNMTVVPGILTLDSAGSATGSSGGQADPKVRVTVFAQFSPVQDLSVTVQERWRSHLSRGNIVAQDTFADPLIEPVAYTNLNLAWSFRTYGTSRGEFFLNVQNLFNKQPPVQQNLSQGSVPGSTGGYVIGDDVVGRYFTAGIRFKL